MRFSDGFLENWEFHVFLELKEESTNNSYVWLLFTSLFLVMVAVLRIWMLSGMALWLPAISISSINKFLTHLGDSSVKGDVSVLLVHVMHSRSRVILDDNSVSLHLVGILLENLS